MRALRTFLAVAAALMVAAVPAWGQIGDVEIVDLNLSRYDQQGRVTMVVEFRNLTEPLDPALLEVTVNGEPVSNADIRPISQSRVAQGVVLVIDVSGSMEGEAIEAAKTAARQFVLEKRPEDFIALVTFNDQVTVRSNFTNSTRALIDRIDTLTAEGGTALFDGVVRASELFATASGQLRRNAIILSDGLDEDSTATLQDAIASLQARDVRTFGVGLESEAFTATDLQAITDATGGILLTTTNPGQLANLYSDIQRELGNTLVVSFNAGVADPTEVDFAISYGALTASVTQQVPGFITTTTGSGTTTTVTYAMAEPVVVSSPLPLPRDQMKLLIVLSVAAAAALLLFIVFGGNRDEDVTFMRRLAAYGRRSQQEEKKSIFERIPLFKRLTARAEEEARRRGLLGAINTTLEQGNIPMTAGEAIAAAFGLALLIALLTGLFTFSLIAGVIAGAVALLFAFAAIRFIGAREKRKFEGQLPDTLTLISTSLRAGYSLLQAVEAVAQEAPNPTAREFGRAIAEARLGVAVVDALRGITERTQSNDFEWAVMAIEIQREVGGNLAEVLQTVADTMMARNRLKGEIRALTAEGRISAVVLGSLPFAMGLFLWVSNREYLMPLFENTFGLIGVGVGLLLLIAGIIWLRKIVNIEV